ncbi:DUF6767 domain-containing protein [Acidipropionibacterium timonense]|uniref:DUF6767 domain-containing protein n=1 Tax=Acidipropionibacterium timonense TaxID=2161818 RepID=UPI0010309811|nr:DUF6767 domain-containing protein [Acidipropionibacterium timonense]
MGRPQPQCPLRPGEPCTLCQLFVTGPQDCGLVYLVMGDDDLRDELVRKRAEARARQDDELGPDPRAEGLD